jgi:hypothetical protein
MTNTKLKHLLWAYGPETRLAYVRWAPSSADTQTLSEAQGVSTVTRSGAGAYTVNLPIKPKDLIAIVQVVENDTTHYHFARVESQSATAGTVTLSHKSVAFASVASGPTASDTVDQLEVLIIMRVAS